MPDIPQTPQSVDSSSQLSSTPRSVITDLDAQELDTANTLLQLGTASAILEARYDNSELLPVNCPPLDDFTRKMKERDTDNSTLTLPQSSDKDSVNDANTDSDQTIDYNQDASETSDKTLEQTPDGTVEQPNTPKGRISYKQYGIRKSPVTAPIRNLQCYYCEAICHSKRELNNHHKAEHTTVKCATCPKIFLTPDALLRHQYIHQESHHYKCPLCDKTCAFKSDLDMHVLKHIDDKIWYCSFDGCTRDFKRKSDLTAHEVVHKGEDFICEFPKCPYSSKDPRLVKRHQRVHTREAKVRCPDCHEKFIFSQQLKRHRKMAHP